MEALYARARQSVKDKIAKYGGTAIISRTSGDAYDDEGNPLPVVTTSKKIRAIYRDGSFFNAGSYLAGKASLLLDFTYAPSPQDRVSMGGTDWTIDSVIAVKPDGVTVINYTVVLE